MKQDNMLNEIVESLVNDSLDFKENKIQLFKNYGQMDPFYLLGDDFIVEDDDENIMNFLTNRMRGYSANIIQEKSENNRIYWRDNDEVTQNKTHYLGKTIVDTLAIEIDDGIQIYNSFGRPINSSDRPKLITDKTFEESLHDLKNVSESLVKKVLNLYNDKLQQRNKTRYVPLILKDNVVEQNRNYNILK
ncbi:MAG: hypothetical protein ACMXX9_04175 [Candidatus Woesearchaeota archaeon]